MVTVARSGSQLGLGESNIPWARNPARNGRSPPSTVADINSIVIQRWKEETRATVETCNHANIYHVIKTRLTHIATVATITQQLHYIRTAHHTIQLCAADNPQIILTYYNHAHYY